MLPTSQEADNKILYLLKNRPPRVRDHAGNDRFSRGCILSWVSGVSSPAFSSSVPTLLAFSEHMGIMTKYGASFLTSINRVLPARSGPCYVLQLPREIRDCIYDLVVVEKNERRKQSHVCLYELPSDDEFLYPGNHEQYAFVMVSMVHSVPNFYTSSVFQVCKQIRCETLDALCRSYRSLPLVITVVSLEERSGYPKRIWLPDISNFPRVRFDIVMSSGTARAMTECFCFITTLLKNHQELSLHLLEIRLGYSYANASSAIRDQGLALTIRRDDVLQCMRQLVPLLQACKRQTVRAQGGVKGLIRVSWGVSKEHMEKGEFDCHCSYLSAYFLEQTWEMACGRLWKEDEETLEDIPEEYCRNFGCTAHHE